MGKFVSRNGETISDILTRMAIGGESLSENKKHYTALLGQNPKRSEKSKASTQNVNVTKEEDQV